MIEGELQRKIVDFLVSDERGKPISAIQVSMEISHPDTFRRELEPLVSTASYFGTQENLPSCAHRLAVAAIGAERGPPRQPCSRAC